MFEYTLKQIWQQHADDYAIVRETSINAAVVHEEAVLKPAVQQINAKYKSK